MTNPSSSASCPSCGTAATGRFCSSCGTALAGAACSTCGASLTTGAHFCHRCGTPAGAASAAGSRGFAGVLPWAVAALALVSLIALIVGQRFGSRDAGSGVDVLEGANGQGTTVITAPGAAGAPAGSMPRAPDISQMSPGERAERLYDRIMTEHEAGNEANVRAFMPMVLAAYEMLAPLNLDQHYDMGRIGIVGGDSTLARAEADTILASRPTHLLGLLLGAEAARMAGNEPRARQFDQRFATALPQERNAGLAEYLLHKNDIDVAAKKIGR